MAPRSKVETLPSSVREWLDRALTERNFSGYRELEALLREKGYRIGRAQISRYGQKVQRRFAAIREATEMARIITEGAEDDQDKRSEAIIATIQADILTALIDVREASDEDMLPAERASLLAKVGKSIATLTRSSVSLKRYQTEVREKIAARLDALEQEATQQGKGHVSLETLKRVREEIYGIIA
ncbi:hypothetical protein CBG25_19370 [Arsenophonus sp. ENCA]|uniref:DUF3486 family protein n=1 Tax=Arsenophonus sp. ENCA TaxID=1987579 RepID=UPI000BD09B75|nr:DUF3486 family protein [Arsenophonus sp. ENCA]PAV00345.1 hypothetical protein CBG25_19370 [Arsenophonus sp. ENCA]